MPSAKNPFQVKASTTACNRKTADMDEFFIREYRDEDLPALALHWKESVGGWPPGFMAQVGDCTEESIREWLMRKKYFAVWLGWLGDRIVSFISYARYFDDVDVTYVDLFNAHPSYHGKGYGRAVLVKAVERAVRDKVKRLDLHTWAANLKAMPLYKKCGFFWRPGTQVHMYNFLPTVLNNELVRDFLGDADWYPSLHQNLDQKEDSETYDGCYYHKYRFERGGRVMEVLVDPSTSGVASIETDDYAIKCEIPGETHVAGFSQPVKWTFRWSGGRPARIKIACEPGDRIKYGFNEDFELRGERIFDTVVTPNSDIVPEHVDWHGKPIACRIELDGRRTIFKPGVRAVRPFKLMSAPWPLRMTPGEERELVLNLDSGMQSDAVFTPRLRFENVAPVGDIEPPSEVEIQSQSSFGIKVKVRAMESEGFGKVSVGGHLKVGDAETEIHPLNAHIGVAPAGYPVEIPDDDPDSVIVSNGLVALKAAREGGNVQVWLIEPPTKVWDIYCDEIGEPFSDEFRAREYDVSVERSGQSAEIVLRAESSDWPGIRLERRLRIGAGYGLSQRVRVFNDGKKPFSGRVRYRPGFMEFAVCYVPVDGMIVKGSRENWHRAMKPLPNDPSRYSEPWMAWERQGGSADDFFTTGLIFDGARHLGWIWSMKPFFEYAVDGLQPGRDVTLPELRIIVKADNWRSVQNEALNGRISSLPTRPRFFMHAESPLIADDPDRGFIFRMMRSTSTKGVVSVALPNGKSLEASSEEWSIDKPIELKAPNLVPGEYGLKAIDYKLQGMSIEFEGKLPLIVPAPGNSVRIEKGREDECEFYRVDNGVIEYNVAPTYCGSVYRLAEKSAPEKNLLRTAFPKPGMWIWWNPWYGGLKMSPWMDFRFHESHFEGDVVRLNWGGREWEGIRVSVTPKRKWHSLGIELYYLTRPGIPLILALARFRERSGNSRRFEAEMVFVPLPSGDPGTPIEAMVDELGSTAVGVTSAGGGGAGTGNWCAIFDPETGKTVGSMIGRGGAFAWDAGSEGRVVWMATNVDTSPDEVIEVPMMVVLADDPGLVKVLAESFVMMDGMRALSEPERIGTESIANR
jgi:GNAT superfamily N-acetyltransferase